MASGEARTEKPTGKRREDAKKRGQVAHSHELSSSVTLIGMLGVMMAGGVWLYNRLAAQLASFLSLSSYHGPLTRDSARSIFTSVALNSLIDVMPFLVIGLVLSLSANLAQVGFTFSGEKLKPDIKRMNPINGLKRYKSLRTYIDLLRSLLKLTVVGLIAIFAVFQRWDQILLLSGAQPGQIIVFTAKMVLSIGLQIGIVLFILSFADYAYQRWQTTRDLKMTKQEVKDESKQQEMSPHMRGRIKQAARDAARARMLTEVPNADVVITNPTHFAVALAYSDDDYAPQVLAKGADLLAARIRELAQEAGVPIVENPPLARALYRTVEVGKQIPETLFAAVAEVLAFVYRQQGKHIA